MEKRHLQNDFLARLALDGKSDVILDALPVGVEIYAPDGRMLYMSEADARIFGADREAVIGSGSNLFDNPNLPPDVKDAVVNRKAIHRRLPYDFDLIREKGFYYPVGRKHIVYIECNGRPIFASDGTLESYVFIIEDVTEIVHKEEELNQSKLKTQLAIKDSGIMLWEFDALRKVFYSDNEPINSYDKSQTIPIEMYLETVHPDDRSELGVIMDRMAAGDDFNFSLDARILFPDNQEWQYCTVSGLAYERDEHGCVVKYVGTRKNNTELQKRELMQEKILNSIPLPIHIKDVEDNFRYVFCNEESKRMFGTSVDKTTYDVMSEEQVARIEKTDKEVFVTGTPYLGSERIELKDGRIYETIVRKSVIYDEGRRLLLNIRWDQSLQNDLERRSKLLSISLETMNSYSWFFEPDKDIISFGDGFEREGRNMSRLNTLSKFIEAVHQDDRALFAGTIRETLSQKSGVWSIEYRVDLNGSGTYEWWQVHGLLETTIRDDVPYQFMYGMSINIDAHKQTELKLLRNKEELDNLVRQNELVLNNTNSGLAYITTDYIVQWENVSLCSKSLSFEAYKKGEFCYKSAQGRTTPCENCIMQRAIQSEQLEQIQFCLNNDRRVEVFATPVINNGTVEGVVIRVDDVTERERMIEELRQAKAMAEQSDKLKSAFLANMSHEIRTPLNAIVGFSELIINDPNSEEREEYVRIINSNNELLLKLINDILDLSKIEAGSVELKYEEFDLSDYFNSIVSSMKQHIKNPNVRLIAANPHDQCSVRLDKNRVAQIFTNYVTNAIKYTPKGFIEMGYETMDDGIRFYVKDTGIGIPDDKKSKVFHRFEKLDEFAQGTGLGLSICMAIAKSMGGKVGFESQFGEGSLFWAFLPCTPVIGKDRHVDAGNSAGDEIRRIENTSKEATNGNAASADSERRYKVLIAEDIPSNYLLVSSLLRNSYDLIHAENGQQAVEMVRAHHPDLVLMDMKMPVMDGMKATAEIRKFDRAIPIVALTAHAFDSDRQAALAIGCNDYLVKPINREQLTAIMDKFCVFSDKPVK